MNLFVVVLYSISYVYETVRMGRSIHLTLHTEKANSPVSIFLQIFQLTWMKFGVVPRPVGALKLTLNILLEQYSRRKSF